MKLLKIALQWVIITTIIALILGLLIYHQLLVKKHTPAPKSELFITPNTTYNEIIESIGQIFQIRNKFLFISLAEYKHLNRKYKPGYYRFDKPATTNQIINRLILGDQTPIKVVFNSLPTLQHLAGVLDKQLMADSSDFLAEFVNMDKIHRYGFTSETFPVMFIPNTYECWWTESPDNFLKRMNVEYNRFWTEERQNKAKKINLNRIEVSVLASIVEKETAVSSEYPIIAGVYLNRLRKKMPLQADPTVIFALGNQDVKRVTKKMLEIDSPYNTYKRTGLPPGPICLPSTKAIDAVLNAVDHKFLYFCASPELDGTHRFSITSHEHAKNATLYRQKLNALKIFR